MPAKGVAINVSTRKALLDDISQRLHDRHGFSVATLNLDHVVKLRHDPAFRQAYEAQSYVVADGNPIVWLSRLAGHRVELVPGSELIDPVAAMAAEQGAPLALVGATRFVLETAANRLLSIYPKLSVVCRIAPAMGFDPTGPEADRAIAEIGASGARVCLIALGAPKQEIFAARAQERLVGVGFVSIGAGLDFIAGTQSRAPAVMRALAMEWLWRLISNPGRLARRYGACAAILPHLFWHALRCRRIVSNGSEKVS